MRELIYYSYLLGCVVAVIYYWYRNIKEYQESENGSITLFDIIATFWFMMGSWLGLALVRFGEELDEINIISKGVKVK